MAITLPIIPCSPVVPTAPGCITTWMGGQICPPSIGFDPLKMAMEHLKAVGIAFQPMIPIISTVKVATDAGEIFKKLATGDLPGAFVAAGNFVTVDIPTLGAMAPAVAFPLMLMQWVAALKYTLIALRAKLVQYAALQALLQTALNNAIRFGNLPMQNAAICARENVDAEILAMVASFGPITTIVGTINGAFCLIGLPPLAPLPLNIDPADINAALEPIDAAIALLDAITFPTFPITPFQC